MSLLDRSFAAAVVLIVSGGGSPAAAAVQADGSPSRIFATKCSSCHTFGQGDRVGPDLKGVTTRRARSWLVAWIRSADRVIRSGDATAVALVRQYKGQRMPDHDLSDAEIHALLDYLARGGPEAEGRGRFRDAATATPADVERGHSLFFGRRTAAGGDVACASCHALSGEPLFSGGSLAPDLTHAYSKYQDKALAALLAGPCAPRVTAVRGGGPSQASDAEVAADGFALRAYLRHVDQQAARPLLERMAAQDSSR